VPQIEVSFDLDANGILNVTALDKTTGKKNNITIKYNKGRLSESEINRIIQDAEKYRAEDEAQRKKVEAKNNLENYAYSVKNSVHDPQVGSKLEGGDKEKLEASVNEAISWLEAHPQATAEEYDNRRKELEETVNPIMMKMYQGSGGMPPGGMPGGFPGGAAPGGAPGGSSGPTVEEVD
jgi:L1 cell adhesion molecule like protein